MNALIAVMLAAAGTYLIRSGSARVFATRSLGPRASLLVRLAALGVMGSLVTANLPAGRGPLALSLPGLAGLLAAVVAARRSRGAAAVMAIGVAAYALAGVATG